MKQKLKPNPLIEAELFNDEELVWWGQPIARYMVRNINIPQLAMSIFLIAFATFFYFQAQEMLSGSRLTFGRRSGLSTTFLPILFTIVPAFMILRSLWSLSTPLQEWIKGKRTYYALTNKRAIIIEQMTSKKVQSFYEEQFYEIGVLSYADGIGDITFAINPVERQSQIPSLSKNGLVKFEDGGKIHTITTYQVQQGFRAIEDVRVVEDFIAQIFFNDDNAIRNKDAKI